MATYNAQIAVQVKNLGDLKNLENRVGLLHTRFTKLNAAAARVTAPFQGHIKAITELNELLTKTERLMAPIAKKNLGGGSRSGSQKSAEAQLKVHQESLEILGRQVNVIRQAAQGSQQWATVMGKLVQAQSEMQEGSNANLTLIRTLLRGAQAVLREEKALTQEVEQQVDNRSQAVDEAKELLGAEREIAAALRDSRRETAAIAKEERNRADARKQFMSKAKGAGRAVDNAFGNVLSNGLAAGQNALIRGAGAAGLMAMPGLGAGVRAISHATGPLQSLVDGLGHLIQQAHAMPAAWQAAIAAMVGFSPLVVKMGESVVKVAPKVGSLAKMLTDVTGVSERAKPALDALGRSWDSLVSSSPATGLFGMGPNGMDLTGKQAPYQTNGGDKFNYAREVQLTTQAVQQLNDRWWQQKAAADSWVAAVQQGKEWIDESVAATRQLEQAQSDVARKSLEGSGTKAAKQSRDNLTRMGATPAGSNMYPDGAGPGHSRTAVEGAVVNSVKRVAALEAGAIKDLAQLEMSLDRMVAMQELEASEKQYLADIDFIENTVQAQLKADKLAGKSWEKQFKRREARQEAAMKKAEDQAARLESIMLGVGFPMMFGAGPASILGSLAGSFAGQGFGGQIFFGALGQKLDDLSQAAMETGKALLYPIESFQQLKDAALFANRTQEQHIENLIELGKAEEAALLIRQQLIQKIGVDSLNKLQQVGKAADELNKAWGELNLQMQALISGPLNSFLNWLTLVARAASDPIKSDLQANDVMAGLSPEKLKELRTELAAIARQFPSTGGIVDERAIKAQNELLKKYEQFAKPLEVQKGPVDFKQQFDDASKLLADQEKAESLRRQGVQLEMQATDMRRAAEDRIYAKRMEAARLEIANTQRRAQLEAGREQLDYAKRIAEEEGFVAKVMQAEADLQRVKKEGAAQLAASEKLYALEVIDLERENEKYIFDLERQIYQWRISAADYLLEKQKETIRLMADPAARAKAMGELTKGGVYTQGGIGPNGKDQYGAHFDIKKQGGGFFNRNALDQWVVVDGKALSSGTTVKGGEYGAKRDGGKRTHQAWDYAFGAGAQLSLKNGASWVGSSSGNYGDNAVFMTPDGEVYRIIHGKFTPGAQQTREGQVAPPTLPDSSAMDQRLLAAKRDALDLTRQESMLREQQSTLALELVARGEKNLETRRQELLTARGILASTSAVAAEIQKRNEFEVTSAQRLATVAAENAKVLESTKLEGEERQKLVDALARRLEITKEQISLDRELLAVQEEQRFQSELANAQLQQAVAGKGLEAGFIGQAGSAYESELMKSGDPLNARKLAEVREQTELATKQAQLLEQAYGGIGNAVGQAMTSAVDAMITGTKSAQEVFADFLKAVGDMLLQTAAQMIAQYIAIGLAKAFAGMGSNPGPSTAADFQISPNIGLFGGGFADGGYPPVGKPSIVGERGPELFIPGQPGLIAPNDIFEATRQAVGGEGGSADRAFADNTQALAVADSYTRERVVERDRQTMLTGAGGSMTIQTQVINNVEYATVDQVQKASAQSARQARAQVFADMRNKPSTRSSLGMR